MFAATGIKSWFRDASTWTEAMIFVSESCQICNSCRERTPSISRIELRTSSIETVDGTPCRRTNEVLRTADLLSVVYRKYRMEDDIPRGKADENMITVMTKLMIGSK